MSSVQDHLKRQDIANRIHCSHKTIIKLHAER